MVTTLPKPGKVAEAQEALRPSVDSLNALIAQAASRRQQRDEADTSVLYVQLGEADLNGESTTAIHKEIESTERRKRQAEASLSLIPDKIRPALAATWEGMRDMEQVLIELNTAEAEEGHQAALKPFLDSGMDPVAAERALVAMNQQPSRPAPSTQPTPEYTRPERNSALLGGYQTQWEYTAPAVVQITQVTLPQWQYLMDVTIPGRQRRISDLARLIKGLPKRPDDALEAVGQKVGAEAAALLAAGE